MNKERLFDCAQVLILPGSLKDLPMDWVIRLIRSKQFWHVLLSGPQADVCAKALREFPGMPNFLVETEGSAESVKAVLVHKGIVPKTLAVTEKKYSEYVQVFPDVRIFVVSEGE